MIHQYDKFLALMNNFDTAIASTNTALNSNGSAMQENEKHVNSIEGKMATLKATLQGFWTSLIDSNTVKNVVDGLTNLVEVLGQLDLKTVVAGLSFVTTIRAMSSAMSTFKLVSTFTEATQCVGLFQKMMFAMIKPTVASGVAMTGTAVATGGLSAGFGVLTTSIKGTIATSLAFMATPLGIVLGTLALVLGGVTIAFMNNAKEQKIFDEKVRTNKDSVDSLTESLKTMNAEGVKEASKPLQDKQDQYQEELARRKKLIDEMNDLKESESKKGVSSHNKYLTGESNGSSGSNYTTGAKNASSSMTELESKIKASELSLQGMNKEFKESGIEIDQNTGRIKQLTDAMTAMEIPDATKSYKATEQAIGDMKQRLEQFNAEGIITESQIVDINSKYPESVGLITDVATAQQFLNGKIDEQVEVQKNAYATMQQDNQGFYQDKLLKDEQWVKSVRDGLVAIGASTSEANNFDLNSFATLSEMKTGIMNQFGKGVDGFLTNFVNNHLSGYGIDVNNFRSAGEAKLAMLNAIDAQIAKVNANMVGSAQMAVIATGQKQLGGSGSIGQLADKVNAQAKEEAQRLQWELQALQNGRDKINTSLGGFGGNYSGYKPSSSTTVGGGNNGSYSPDGSGSDKKDKEAKEEKEKEVPLIEDLTDRYHTLNNELNDYNVLLAENKVLQESATGEQKAKLVAREIELLQKKKQATKDLMEAEIKQKNEIKNIPIMKEFEYDADGDITNYNQIMENKRRYANQLSNAERETYSKYIDDLVKTAKQYEDLNSKIEDHNKELKSLDATMRNMSEDMLTDIRDRWVDARKKQLEEEKKGQIDELDNRIKKLKDEIKSLDDEDADKQKKLMKLQAERDKWNSDDSILGRKKIKELNAQIAELQKEIQKDQLQAQIDEIEKTKEGIEDNYKKMLDEKKLYNEIDKLLSEGNMQAIIDLIASKEDDFKSLGNLLGNSISSQIKIEVENAMKALDLLKSGINNFGSGGNTSTPTPSKPSTPQVSTPPPSSNTGGGTPSKGSRVKVTDVNSSIYADSYTGSSSGTWRGAGISASDSLYVVNDSNGKMALSRTNNINGAIGWIDKNKIAKFKMGGMTPSNLGESGALGILHKNERVLTEAQTTSFDKLISMLPKLSDMVNAMNLFKPVDYSKLVMANSGGSNDVSITNEFNITNNTPMDVIKTEKSMTEIMKTELRKFGKLK